MKILLLGSDRPKMVSFLESFNDNVITVQEKISEHSPVLEGADFLISYGYRHIIGKPVIDKFPLKIVNLHISFLPWNRGADPNVWSFLEDTPKGVTIHYINEGLDAGPIISQRPVDYTSDDTLRTMYDKLTAAIETLFYEEWPKIRSHGVTPFYPVQKGSFHSTKERYKYETLLTEGWDTPVINLIGKHVNRRI